MLRGRHRGLPVAVDRAVVLPSELVTSNYDAKGRPQHVHGPHSSHAEMSEHVLSPVAENPGDTSMERLDQAGDLSNAETLHARKSG